MNNTQSTILPDGSITCANCGEAISPNSQVSVLMEKPTLAVCHSEYQCSSAGNCRYGYWGSGKLESVFGEIEQC